MASLAFEDLVLEVLNHPKLNPSDKDRVQAIGDRWRAGVIPSGTDRELINRLYTELTEVRSCRFLEPKRFRCLHADKRDPVAGAPLCSFPETQPKCPIYQKGDY